MAAFQKLPSGNWRALIRRKGSYTSETFRRRRDAEQWALEMERRVDRGESVSAKRPRDISTFGDLVDLHIADMHEVKKPLRRSKAYSLRKLKEHLGKSTFNRRCSGNYWTTNEMMAVRKTYAKTFLFLVAC